MGKNKYRAHSRRAQASRVRYRGCRRKRAFPTREAAEQKGNDVYHCRFCKQWHRTGQIAMLANRLAKTKSITP